MSARERRDVHAERVWERVMGMALEVGGGGPLGGYLSAASCLAGAPATPSPPSWGPLGGPMPRRPEPPRNCFLLHHSPGRGGMATSLACTPEQ